MMFICSLPVEWSRVSLSKPNCLTFRACVNVLLSGGFQLFYFLAG